MVFYVPGTEERDLKKVIMSLQQIGGIADTAAGKNTGYEAAWTTYTPTITAASGTFTSVSGAGAYLAIGKLVHVAVTITITTVGTASGQILCPLPLGTAKRDFAFAVREYTASGVAGIGLAQAASGQIAIVKYDNSTLAGSGNTIAVSGIYER